MTVGSRWTSVFAMGSNLTLSLEIDMKYWKVVFEPSGEEFVKADTKDQAMLAGWETRSRCRESHL